MATLNFHRLIVGKMKIGIYWIFIADILTNVFFRNVCWVVLYQTYSFCPNFSVSLVVIATKRQNLQNIFKKYLNSSEAIWGIKLKLCRNVHSISLCKNIVFLLPNKILFKPKILFFIAVAQALWLVWQLKSFLRLIMWKMEIGFNCCLIAGILTELF